MTERPSSPATVQDSAAFYLEQGFEPIPLRAKEKHPVGSWKEPINWQDTQNLGRHFGGAQNIGIALGARSRGLIDVDLDWLEAALIADLILADLPTFGRAGSPRSHRVAISPVETSRLALSIPTKLADELNIEKGMVVELRADGHYTMFPPSTHPSGESVEWEEGFQDIPLVDADELEQKVRLIAFLAVILKFYPKVPGQRDEVCLALAGTLIRAGLEADFVDRLVEQLARLAGDDEWDKRGNKGERGRDKVQAGEPSWGLPALCEKLGLEVLEPTLRSWLGMRAQPVAHMTGEGILVTPGNIPEEVSAAELAMLNAGVEVYQRGGELVRVAPIESGVVTSGPTLTIVPVKGPWLKERLSEVTRWSRPTKDGQKPTDPPSSHVAAYLARVGEWRVPALKGLSSTPLFLPDGRIVDQEGYDAASRLFLNFGGTNFGDINPNPAEDDAKLALEVLAGPLRGYDFETDEDQSVAVAALLTGLIRPLLPTAPMFLFDAPTAGSGKSILAETVAIVSTGNLPAMIAQGRTEEEFEKRLGALLLQANPMIVIDNCERPLEGEILCSMLTQEQVTIRPLGVSEAKSLPTASMMIATGNNLSVRGDVARRALICRIDPRVEKPEERSFTFDPRDIARTKRAELVVAGLTILRAYHLAGRPVAGAPLGSFSEWDVVRQSLIWLGQPDPVATRRKLQVGDDDHSALLELLTSWHSVFGDKPISLAELDAQASTGPTTAAAGVAKQLVQMIGRPDFNTRSIGRQLQRYQGRIVGGLVLKCLQQRSGVKAYFVQRASDGSHQPRLVG